MVYPSSVVHCLLQTPDTLKASPSPFDAGVQEFDLDKTVPVSVLNTDRKWMRVQDVKDMSWEQHVSIWKVTSCCNLNMIR